MKKVFIFIVIVACAVKVNAEGEEFSDNLKGPVKQVTISLKGHGGFSLFYGSSPSTGMKTIMWYDSIGRLSERAMYEGDKLDHGYIRQYTINGVCMEYEYDNKGIVKGNYCVIRMDSLGRQICSRRYREGLFSQGDSTVYDVDGRKIEKYDTYAEKDSFKLCESYAYDSIGRLSKVCKYWPEKAFYFDSLKIPREYLNCGVKHMYTIEYFPNGNYTEHHVVKDGKKWDVKYTVDKDGRLIKKEEKENQATFRNYDKYGNWLKMTGTMNSSFGSFSSTTVRVIEYYE